MGETKISLYENTCDAFATTLVLPLPDPTSKVRLVMRHTNNPKICTNHLGSRFLFVGFHRGSQSGWIDFDTRVYSLPFSLYI